MAGSADLRAQNTELAFVDNLAACDGLTARRHVLDERLSHVATDPEFWPLVRRLRAFRGIDTLSALIIVLEVCRLHPVLSARCSWDRGWGWCLRASSPASPITTGRSRRPARSTPGGSWSRRHGITPAHPGSGKTLYERQEGLPDHVLQIARRAQSRLYRIHRRMRERRKPGNVITVACARELACFLLGRRHRAVAQLTARPRSGGEAPGPEVRWHARCCYGQPSPGHARS